MERSPVLDLLASYQPYDETESGFCQRLTQFISRSPRFHDRYFFHDGHVTSSAWIVSPDYARTLLVHHAKLERWLQPGGHLENDESILAGALREAGEETGIQDLVIPDVDIFDLDIHPIPARKKEPEHFHYDIRFLFIADPGTTVQVSAESNDLRWFRLDEVEQLNEGPSITRMVSKTRLRHD